MAEDQFAGGAYFEIGGSLEPLERRLKDAEQVITNELVRVESVADRAAQQIIIVEYAADRASGGVLSLITNLLAIKSATGLVFVLVRALGLVAAIGAAASAAVAALAPAIAAVAVGAAAVGLGFVIEQVSSLGERVLEAGDRINRALKNFDGSRESAEELSEALRQLPIVGGLAANFTRVFAGDATQSERALANWVSRIEDGKVELTTFGKTAGLAGTTLTFFGSLLTLGALKTQRYRKDIEDINDAIDGFRVRMRVIAQLRAAHAGIGASAAGLARDQSRQLSLERASPRSSAELQGLFASEDLDAAFDAKIRQLREANRRFLDSINEQESAGEISDAAAADGRRLATDELRRAEENINNQRERGLAAARRLTDERLRQLDAEKEINSFLSLRRFFRSQKQAEAEADALEAELGGRDFEAERIRTRADFDNRADRARFGGLSIDIETLERQRDARLKMIDQQEARAEAAAIERREQQLADYQSRLAELEARAAGDIAGADIERLERRYGRLIAQAIKVGDVELQRTLEQLLEVEGRLAEAGEVINRNIAGPSLAQQASRAEVAAAAVGGTNSSKPVVDALTKQTQQIVTAIERGVPATFAP